MYTVFLIVGYHETPTLILHNSHLLFHLLPSNLQYKLYPKTHLVMQLSLPNPLMPGVKSRMKMWFEQRPQAMLQLHVND